MKTQSSIVLCTGLYTSLLRAQKYRLNGFNVQPVDIYEDQSRVGKPRMEDTAQAWTREWSLGTMGYFHTASFYACLEGAMTRAELLKMHRIYLVGFGVAADYALTYAQKGISRGSVRGVIAYYPHFVLEDVAKISLSVPTLLIYGAGDDGQILARARELASAHENITLKIFPGKYGFANAFMRGHYVPLPNRSYHLKSSWEAAKYEKETLKQWNLGK